MKQKFINVHCHILNFDFIPNSFFKVYSIVRERILRLPLTELVLRVLSIFPCMRRFAHVLLMQKSDIKDVARNLSDEMYQTNVVLATPLMMDLELASYDKKPEIPYRSQVVLLSEIARQYPGRLMPFIMFDPRRRAVAIMIIKALEELGFLGVKMYPPLGYHPDPGSFYNDALTNGELLTVYKYCVEKDIPITVHCSKGGAYSGDLKNVKKLVHDYCKPSSWIPVLERFPNLRINFGHFGGCDDLLEKDNPGSWALRIKDLILNPDYKNVYADISYHDKALDEKTSDKYFCIFNKLLEDKILKSRILFGTDWYMARHRWTEKKYVKAFVDKLDEGDLKMIAFENPMRFLFPNRTLPDRIIDFYKRHGIEKAELPPWMKDYFGY
jgi:predicted TIM-barrel fold metal-dependent hydrolase